MPTTTPMMMGVLRVFDALDSELESEVVAFAMFAEKSLGG